MDNDDDYYGDDSNLWRAPEDHVISLVDMPSSCSSSSCSSSDEEDEGYEDDNEHVHFLDQIASKERESIASTGWRYVKQPKARKKTKTKTTQKKQRLDVQLPDAERARRLKDWYDLECPATPASAQLFISLPTAVLLMILRYCTMLDVMTLKVTCRMLYYRFSCKERARAPLAAMKDAVKLLTSSLMRAAALGDISQIPPEVYSTASLLAHMAEPDVIGVWSWPHYLQAAARMPIWPVRVSRVTGHARYAALNKTDTAACDALQTLSDVKNRFSSGKFCNNCTRPIHAKDSVPRNWTTTKGIPYTLCFVCLTERRELRWLMRFFSNDTSTVPSVSFPVLDQQADRLNQLPGLVCRTKGCGGHIQLVCLTIGGKITRAGIGQCSNPIHRATFGIYVFKGTVWCCPEEVRAFFALRNASASLHGDDNLRLWYTEHAYDSPDIIWALTKRTLRSYRRKQRQ